MKRSSSNTNINEKPTKQTDSGKKWVLGTWLNRLAQYVHHKNADDNEPPRSDTGNLTNSAASVQNDTSNYGVHERIVTRADQDSLGNGSVVVPSLNRTGFLSVKRSSTFSSSDAARRSSVVNNSSGDMSQQARTPLVRRFTRDSSMSSGIAESGQPSGSPGNGYSRTSQYPTSQMQYAGVGIMPSVKLAQFGDRRLPTLGAHNSLMSVHNSVRVKIAPPDATHSPLTEQRLRVSDQSSCGSSAGSRESVATALGENRSMRKRLYSGDANVTDKLDNQQAKRRRSNAEEANTSIVNNQMLYDTTSAVYSTHQVVSNVSSISSSSRSNKFGARNPIDVSYLSSRQAHKQGQDDRSTLASPDGSFPISRTSSISGRFLGSQIRLLDDGRVSAGNSDSPFASAPSSGRNTPAPSLDGLKSDCSTPVLPSLDATRQDVTPEKHRQLLLIKDGSSKRRLAPLSSDIVSSFQLSAKRKHSLSAKDYDKDRRMEMEQARLLLRDVTAGSSERRGSNQFKITQSLVPTEASATQSVAAITPISQTVASVTTTSGFLPAFGIPQSATSSLTTLSTLPTASVSSALSESNSSVPKESNDGFNQNAAKSAAHGTPVSVSPLSATANASVGVTLPSATSYGFSTTSNASPVNQPFTATVSSCSPLGSTVSSAASSQSLAAPVKANEISVDQNSAPRVTSLQTAAAPPLAFNTGTLNSSSSTANQFSVAGFGNTVNSLGHPTLAQSSNASTGFSFGSATLSSGFGSVVSNSSTTLPNSSAPPKSTNLTSTFSALPSVTSSVFGSMLPSGPVTVTSSVQSASQPSFGLLNNSSSASSGLVNSTSNPARLSFGGIQAQTSTSGAKHTPLFTPVFGSPAPNLQQTSAPSVVLGVGKTSSAPTGASTFGGTTSTTAGGFGNAAPTISHGFGAKVTLSSGVFGNTNNNSSSTAIGFGSNSTPSLGFNSAGGGVMPSSFSGFSSSARTSVPTSFQSSPAIRTVFGQPAVNGVANQPAPTASFVFSGNMTEKSLNPPGNGFSFGGGGSNASALGSVASLAATTNGIGFQANTGGFKFGGSGDGISFGGSSTSVAPVFGASNGLPSATPFGSPPMMPGFNSTPTQGGAGAFTIGTAGRSAQSASRRVAARQRAGRR